MSALKKTGYELYTDGIYTGAFTANELQQRLNISRSSLYSIVSSGRTVKRRWKIYPEGYTAWFKHAWDEAAEPLRRRNKGGTLPEYALSEKSG